MSIRDNLGSGSNGGVLDSLEEIEANTTPGKSAGALAVKELNSSLPTGYEDTNTSLVNTTSSSPFTTQTSGIVKCNNKTGDTVAISISTLGDFIVANNTSIAIPVFKGMEVYLHSGSKTSLTFNFRAHTFNN